MTVVPAPLGRTHPDEGLLVACHCYGHHYLRFYCDLDDLVDSRLWFVEVTVRPSGFFARFKYAAKALMGGTALESMEIVLDGPAVREVAAYIERTGRVS